MESSSRFRGIDAILLAGLVFVFNDCLLQLAMRTLPPYEVLTLRGASGIFCAIALLCWRGELRWHPAILSWPVMLRALFETCAILAYIIALAKSALGDVTAIFQTTPLLVILGLILFHGEKASALRLGLVVLGFVGALLVAQPGQGTVSPYVLLALLTAGFAAARDLAARRISPDVPAMTSTLVLIISVFLFGSLATILFESWVMPGPQALALPLVAGFFMMLGHYFTLVAYRLTDAQTVAPFYYGFMVFAVVGGYFVFGDVPNLLGVLGMAIIVISGLAILAFDKRGGPNAFQSPDL